MKEGWKMVKLGEVCETSAGGTPSKLHKEYYENGNIPWMLSGEVCHKYIYDVEHYITQEGLNNSSAKLFPENTVVVAMYGATAGQVGILKLETSTNQAVCGILPNDNILPEYMYYYFLYYKDLLVAQAVGNAQPNISQQKIKSVEFPFLSLEEQHRIVSILDASFKKIDALKKNAEENLKNAKALFQQVLAQELKPKEGWVEKKIGEVCEVINGRAYKQNELLNKGKYKVLRVGNFFTNNSWYYSDLELEENKYCDKGDLLYAWSASFGPKIWDGERVIYHYHIWKMICNDCIDKFYMHYYLQSSLFIHKALKDLHGTTMAHITKGIMESTSISFPSIEEQHRIARTLDTLSEKCRRLEQIAQQTIRECDALKQSILRQAFSGKL